MSQGPLCPNLTKKVQKKVSQIANRNFPLVILLGGLSVNLNHLKTIDLHMLMSVNFNKLKVLPSKARLKIFEIYKQKYDSCINNHSPNIFPVSKIFSLCYSKIPCVFPVWKK